MYGDHTPLVLPGPATLTPLGASQMHDQGAAFRHRYLDISRDDGFVGIVGINSETIDNSQLHIESSTDGCSAAGAMAFMQGLYPPRPDTSCQLPNGSVMDYPVCGYQYPNIRTISPRVDPDSIWGRGHDGCTKHEKLLLLYNNNGNVDSIHQSSKVFYGRLWDKVFSEAFPRSEASFYNAYDLYDYAAHHWTHGNRTRSAMTSEDLERLHQLAWEEQTLRYATISGPGGIQDGLTDAIAGRTLASRVTALFIENMQSRGARNKLNLAFTSHEPFLGFFALTNLSGGASERGPFAQLPRPAATLTFELFSVDQDRELANDSNKSTDLSTSSRSSNGIPYPSIDKLHVRFLYHNTTAADNERGILMPYPLFGSGRSSMSFKHFNATMWQIGVANTTTWCRVCESEAFFCAAVNPPPPGVPALAAALLGALLTLVAVAVVLAVLAFLA
ncbi:histidine phosphatase superfamily [Chaetomium strumarium]|uniref:Histidine phosphatase superfamily n=1 Tax=Chaetomium strumarium TaxID=1170767 RepID=A0AAJ0GQV7_9PEZI|nr:histidine phosphatase superfamily [Chaetomium strumarium]